MINTIHWKQSQKGTALIESADRRDYEVVYSIRDSFTKKRLPTKGLTWNVGDLVESINMRASRKRPLAKLKIYVLVRWCAAAR